MTFFLFFFACRISIEDIQESPASLPVEPNIALSSSAVKNKLLGSARSDLESKWKMEKVQNRMGRIEREGNQVTLTHL